MTTRHKNGKETLVHKCALCPYSTKVLQTYKNHLRTHSTEKPFKCPKCPFKSKWAVSVKAHEKNVHLTWTQSRLFPCPHPGCKYAGKQKSDLTKHSKIHLGKKSFSCSDPDCKYSTNRQGNLTRHTRTHTGEKPHVCQFESCSYASASKEDPVRHTRTHTKEKPFKCPEPNCKYSATDGHEVKRHQLTHPPKEGEEDRRPSFPCPICEYKGKSKDNLTQHIKSHTLEKLFKCDEPNCNFEFKFKGALKAHKLSKHSDEKPFACSFESCEYRSKCKGDLSNHLKIHSEERRYKCELCPYRSKTRQAVTSHLNWVHANPNFKPFKCTEPQCVWAFKTKNHLKRHLLTHNKE